MNRSRNIAIAAAFGAAGILCALGVWLASRGDAAATTPHPVWAEVQWPFPIDEWGIGKAYQCRAADCGAEVNVYVRAKLGFCNCTTGVADDAELERLSDFGLVGGEVAALGAGLPIDVGWMKGRSRAYAVSTAGHDRTSALSAAFNSDCDAIVATAVLGQPQRAKIEPQVIGFLNSQTILQWAKVTLGL